MFKKIKFIELLCADFCNAEVFNIKFTISDKNFLSSTFLFKILINVQVFSFVYLILFQTIVVILNLTSRIFFR